MAGVVIRRRFGHAEELPGSLDDLVVDRASDSGPPSDELRAQRRGLAAVLVCWVAILASAVYIAGQLIRWLAQP